MQVSKNTVVTFDYTLTDESGQVLDSSEGQDPLAYLHGSGTIIPGLESALEGKNSGDELKVTVEPADGYGERIDGLCQEVTRDNFAEIDDLAVGMQFRVPTNDGEQVVVTVIDIQDETVTIDGNHQLAGVTLHFDVAIREVREATAEELEHGHAHGPGGHDHG